MKDAMWMFHDISDTSDTEVLCGNILAQIQQDDPKQRVTARKMIRSTHENTKKLSAAAIKAIGQYLTTVNINFEFRSISLTVDLTRDYLIAAYCEDPIKTPFIEDNGAPRMYVGVDVNDVRFTVQLSTQKQSHLGKIQNHIIYSHFTKDETRDLVHVSKSNGGHQFCAVVRDLLQNKQRGDEIVQMFTDMVTGQKRYWIHVGSKFRKESSIICEAFEKLLFSVADYIGITEES